MKNNHLLKTAVSLCLALVIVFSVFIPAFAASGKWIKSGSRWWYKHTDGTYTKSNWEKINGKWYHFDKKGWMQTGWLKLDGKWYYLNSDGVMATGWKKLDGKWYYLSSSGAMKTGWLNYKGEWYFLEKDDENHDIRFPIGSMIKNFNRVINGKRYGFDSDGKLRHGGWGKLFKKWFFFNDNGTVKTGWLKENGKWYYLSEVYDFVYDNESGEFTNFQIGEMLKNTFISIYDKNNKADKYAFDSDGSMHIGWKQIGSGWYYFDTSGKMVRSQIIDGYYIDSSGKRFERKVFDASEIEKIELAQWTADMKDLFGGANLDSLEPTAAVTDRDKIEAIVALVNGATIWNREISQEALMNMDAELPYELIFTYNSGERDSVSFLAYEGLLVIERHFFEFDAQAIDELFEKFN